MTSDPAAKPARFKWLRCSMPVPAGSTARSADLPPSAPPMTEISCLDHGVALLLVVASPLLVLPTLIVLAVSAVTRALFGADPAAGLVQEHREGVRLIKIIGGCTFGLMAVAGLLGWAM